MQKKRIIFYCHDQNTNLLKSGSLEERKKKTIKGEGKKLQSLGFFHTQCGSYFVAKQKTENS